MAADPLDPLVQGSPSDSPLGALWEVLQPEEANEVRAALEGPAPSASVVLAEVEGDPAPWERREDETTSEYAAFQRYLAMGTGRTVTGFVRQEAALEAGGMRASQARWMAVAQRLDWQSRAAASDEYQAGLELAAYREERLKLRRERQAVLRAYLRVVAEQIKKLAGTRQAPDMADITAALRVIMPELRTEYLDQPEDRLAESTRDGRKVVQFTDIQAFMVRMRRAIGED